MALPSSALSSNCLGSSYEIELKIAEVDMDEALLRNLLEETKEEDDITCPVQSLDVNNYDSPLKIYGKVDLDWLDMMNEAPSLAMDEIMVWYIDYIVGMFDYAAYTGDYSQFYECLSDKTNYCCLWQE
ncbi:hypothetical protein Ddye_000449 [Dipteronia dyeriana]|uniref:Uncharacterized protein n=1 Tax=Dipteronia dyeriana TaxID=168575 RepID=A0AAD9XLY4_9ROSI|nr:hypothetical protein Ddye_000449 [Dipteronia dyeriana]